MVKRNLHEPIHATVVLNTTLPPPPRRLQIAPWVEKGRDNKLVNSPIFTNTKVIILIYHHYNERAQSKRMQVVVATLFITIFTFSLFGKNTPIVFIAVSLCVC